MTAAVRTVTRSWPSARKGVARRPRRTPWPRAAQLEWDSVAGADAYVVVRDGKEIAGPLRLEGARKAWRDQPAR